MDALGIILFILSFQGVLLFSRFIASSFDKDRIRQHFHELDCEIIEQRWAPFGPGWLNWRNDRIHYVLYRNQAGKICQTHLKAAFQQQVGIQDSGLTQEVEPPTQEVASPLLTGGQSPATPSNRNPMNFHFAQLDELPEIECCCGTTQRAFTELPDAPASVHHLKVKDDPTPHYHQKTTEIYLVLEGEGFLELDGEKIPVKPLSTVLIKPGCRHRAIGDLRVVNIPIPKHNEEDFFFA